MPLVCNDMNRNILSVLLMAVWTSTAHANTGTTYTAHGSTLVPVSFSLSFNADSSCNFGFIPGDSSFNSGGLYFRANRQQRFHKSVPPGNYSGITYLGSNRYALVSDKAEEDGFTYSA